MNVWFRLAIVFLVVLGVVVPALAQTEDPPAESCFVGVPGGETPTIQVESSRFEFPSGDDAIGQKVYVARWIVEDKVGCAGGVPGVNLAVSGAPFPSGIMHGSDGVGVFLEVTGSLAFTPLADYDSASLITVTDLDDTPGDRERIGFQFGIRVLPSLEETLPSNLTASHNADGNEITVSWGAPAFIEESAPDPLFEDTGPHYWVRYKLAGTTTYFENLFDPGAETTETISDCSGDTAVTNCIAIEKGKTYLIGVTRRSSGSNAATLPTGTDADWASFYHSIPLADYTLPYPNEPVNNNRRPFVTKFAIEEISAESLPAGVMKEDRSVCFRFDIRLHKFPRTASSVEIIWDELDGTVDIDDFRFTSGRAVQWHTNVGGNFSSSTFTSFFSCITPQDDDVVERQAETIVFRLVNFIEINPESGPCNQGTCTTVKRAEVVIWDDDSSTVGLSASATDVSEDTDVEVVATLSNPVDSRCELGWSLDYATNNQEALTKLAMADLDPQVPASGSFVFEAGEQRSTQVLAIADDGVPEGEEILSLSTSEMNCEYTYEAHESRSDSPTGSQEPFEMLAQTVSVNVSPNDLPVVSTIVAGGAGGVDAHQSATVDWGLGGADVSQVSDFVVRWTEEVTGQDDAYYLTDPEVVWESMVVGSNSALSAVFPVSGSLVGDTDYVVQVGVVTGVGAAPIYSEVLSRVTTGAPPVSAPVTVDNASVFEGESFEVSVVLAEAVGEDVTISVDLMAGSGSDPAEVADFEAGPKTITILIGETTGSVSFSTTIDEDEDAESLVLSVSSSSTVVELSPASIELTIVELLVAPPPTAISVSAGDGATPVSDADRRFSVGWTAPAGVTVGSYQVGWVAKPDDGSVPPDTEWTVVSVPATDLGGVFPSGSALFRASNTAESGVGLEADIEYLVRVRSVVENGKVVWSEPAAVTLGAPIKVTYAVDSAQVIEGGSVSLTARLDGPLSEDVEVTWGLVTADSLDAVASQHTAEADDVTIAVPVTETLVAGQTEITKVFQTVVDNDADDEVFSPFVSFGGDIAESTRLLVTITEPAIAPLPTGLTVAAGGGGLPVADTDRAFSVSWSAPAGETVGSYEVGWAKKPGQGVVLSDSDWTNVAVMGLEAVFPVGSTLYRANHPTETGVGLEAGAIYLVRVRSVVENTLLNWSDPVEVTLDAPIAVSYDVDSSAVDEGGSVTLTASLDRPLSEDLEVTWGLVTADGVGAVVGQHTAEGGDVAISGLASSTLAVGDLSVEKVYQTVRDTDTDDEVFSVFATFGGDVKVAEAVLVTITDLDTPSSSGGGGSSTPTTSGGANGGGSTPSTNPGGSQQPSTPPNTQPPQSSASPNPPQTGGGGGGSGGLPSGNVPTTQTSGDAAQPPRFLDVVGTTHEANINLLAQGGITRGCNPPANTLFCPDRAVTRGEMATFMVRAFGLAESSSNLFGDDNDNTHEDNINALAEAEITRGCNPPENSRYCPDRPVTRAQMATFLARAMDLAEGSGDFTDTADSVHNNDINRIASVGITRGCNPPTNSRYCPDRAVTRGEMATFLTRAETAGSSLPIPNPFLLTIPDLTSN